MAVMRLGYAHVRVTDLLCKVSTEQEAMDYCAAFTQLYREEARYLERTAPWIERVEHRIGLDRQSRRAGAPLGRKRREQIVDASPFAVELADVLWLGAAHVLQGQVRVVVEHAVMRLAFAPGLAGGFVGVAKAVFLHLRVHGLGEGRGIQRRQQGVVAIGAGVVAREPVELLGQRVAAGAFGTRLGQRNEGIAQCLGLRRLGM